MKTRYYVICVQHNKEANAENRTAPNGYNTLSEAVQKYHEQLGKDMKNATLDWSVGYIVDNLGNLYRSEYWEEETEPVEEPVVSE